MADLCHMMQRHQSEINRLEDMLAACRAERDDIGIKYNALSERVSVGLGQGQG